MERSLRAEIIVGPPTLLAAAQAAADFLLRHQAPDGGLAFRVRPRPGGIQRLDNDLHQAGACLALLEAYEETGEDRYRAGAEAGLGLLLEQIRGPRPEDADADFQVVVSGDVGTVGASALALLALLEYRAATGSQRWNLEMEGLARFLAFQEQADGAFELRYPYGDSQGGPFETPFSPSTAALALLRYARTDPEGVLSSWFNDAERGAGWLMAVRDLGKTYDELPHDFRLLQALDELHEHSEGGRTYYLHARRVAQGILEPREDEAAVLCAPRTWNRAAAMVAVVHIARRAEVSPAAYELALGEMLEKLLSCQVSASSPASLTHEKGVVGGVFREFPVRESPVLELRGDDAADAVSLFLAARQAQTLATGEAPG